MSPDALQMHWAAIRSGNKRPRSSRNSVGAMPARAATRRISTKIPREHLSGASGARIFVICPLPPRACCRSSAARRVCAQAAVDHETTFGPGGPVQAHHPPARHSSQAELAGGARKGLGAAIIIHVGPGPGTKHFHRPGPGAGEGLLPRRSMPLWHSGYLGGPSPLLSTVPRTAMRGSGCDC